MMKPTLQFMISFKQHDEFSHSQETCLNTTATSGSIRNIVAVDFLLFDAHDGISYRTSPLVQRGKKNIEKFYFLRLPTH